MKAIIIFVAFIALFSLKIKGEKVKSLENLPNIVADEDLNKTEEIKLLNEIRQSFAKNVLQAKAKMESEVGKQVFEAMNLDAIETLNYCELKMEWFNQYIICVKFFEQGLDAFKEHADDKLTPAEKSYLDKELFPAIDDLLEKFKAVSKE